jgi:hypothetical protein
MLTAPLKAFAEFLRLDQDLIAAAAAGSLAQAEAVSDADVAWWVAALPEFEKTAWLLRLATRQEVHLRVELLRTFRASRRQADAPPGKSRRSPTHGGGQACGGAQGGGRASGPRPDRREQEEAAAREKHLASLARESRTRGGADALIATKRPSDYEAAVRLLKDLADLGQKRGRQAEVRDRLARLRQEHARKPTLLKRLRSAGLLAD